MPLVWVSKKEKEKEMNINVADGSVVRKFGNFKMRLKGPMN